MEENRKKGTRYHQTDGAQMAKELSGMGNPGRGNDYLIEEFSEEISMHVSHLVRRLYENKFLSLSEHHEFMESCYNQINVLHDLIKIKEAETKKTPKGIWA